MANVYTIDFTVTLSTCRNIEAESETEALEIVDRLMSNENFRLDLIESWDDPFSGWGEPNDPTIVTVCDDLPDFDKETLRECYGLE